MLGRVVLSHRVTPVAATARRTRPVTVPAASIPSPDRQVTGGGKEGGPAGKKGVTELENTEQRLAKVTFVHQVDTFQDYNTF